MIQSCTIQTPMYHLPSWNSNNILLVNVYVYCVVNIVVHYDTALWCQFLIASCLCVFVVLIYILYSCVLSTFDCLLSVWLSHVHMYFMQMCAVNMWLFDVIVLLLCLYIYICVLYSCVHLVCLYVLYTAVFRQPLIVCCLCVFVRLIYTLCKLCSVTFNWMLSESFLSG